MLGAKGLHVAERPPKADGAGREEVLLLVHGTMDRSSSFTRLMARLPDWHVVSYDRRGYAGSHHLPPDPDFSLQVDDLLEVLAGRPAVAFGHSLGGDVVLAAMATHPGCISRALVWEPPQPWLAWWPDRSMSRGRGSDLDPADRAELFMRSMVGDRIWERLPAATREQRRAEGPTLSADMASIGAGPVFDPAAITAPVLVGRGGRSRPHHRWAARELAASLPSGELVEIPDSDHGPHLSHPSDLAVLVTVAASRSAPQETQPPEARS